MLDGQSGHTSRPFGLTEHSGDIESALKSRYWILAIKNSENQGLWLVDSRSPD